MCSLIHYFIKSCLLNPLYGFILKELIFSIIFWKFPTFRDIEELLQFSKHLANLPYPRHFNPLNTLTPCFYNINNIVFKLKLRFHIHSTTTVRFFF